MDYETCVQRCIAITQAEGGEHAEADIAAYRAFPSPSKAEWADVLRKTTTYDDTDDALAFMVQYEMRLEQRGFQTPFGSLLKEIARIPAELGVPAEYQADVLRLCFMTMKDFPDLAD